MNAATQRKGATRAADIPADVLHALSHGELQSATLAEGLALDQARLLRTVFPQLSRHTVQRTDAACQFGILKRMAGIGAALLEELGNDGITQCQGHASDTVRGWACFMIGSQAGLSLPRRLAAIRPLADDAHFGVREWAWMAIRPHLAEDLDDAIAHLTKWTTEPSERLRRFASEALRPRGVWCAHIAAFKQQPERALPVLSPLRADLSVYVQDSVANWSPLKNPWNPHEHWLLWSLRTRRTPCLISNRGCFLGVLPCCLPAPPPTTSFARASTT